MNPSPLQVLYQQFSEALLEKGTYLGSHSIDTGNLVKTKQKDIRLQEVFQRAKAQITTILKEAENDAKVKDIVHLRALRKAGKTFYERYDKSTKSWRRSFLKGLAHYTPDFLKRFLPRCFSNQMANAEKATQQMHQDYQALLKQEIQNALLIPLDEIHASWTLLAEFDRKPLSHQNYQATLTKLVQKIDQIIKNDPIKGRSLIEKKGIPREAVDALTSPKLIAALVSKDSQSLIEHLKSTPFEKSFQQALSEKGTIRFGMRNILGKQEPIFQNEQGKSITEKMFESYHGKVSVSIVGELEALNGFMKTHENCRPCAIEIQVKEPQTLDRALIDNLLTLSKSISQVTLKGIEKLDLTQTSSRHFHQIFSFCPNAKSIDLSGQTLNDSQLGHLIAEGFFTNAAEINLKGCNNLTTDCLYALSSLPAISVLELPDLQKGKRPLNQLPKFDNPFKIKLLYTASKETQKIAGKHYTGPQLWAPLFQIPLARQNVSEVFTPRMKVLDPVSVSYWLYRDDYKHLTPQMSVECIFADSNGGLTDANLIGFIQKFPKVRTVSLYNCPHITAKGINLLQKACPHIEIVDEKEDRDVNACPDLKPDLQLFLCQTYGELKQKALQAPHAKEIDAELKKISPAVIKSRIAVELFADKCHDQAALEKVLREPFDPNEDEFSDITLLFKEDDHSEPIAFATQREILSSLSQDFLRGFRTGGKLYGHPIITQINQHATPMSIQALRDLFYGKEIIQTLDWKTAAHVAELVGPKIFQLPDSIYKALLARIHSQFDLSDPDKMFEMFLSAKQLEDEVGLNKYTATILTFLKLNQEPIDLESNLFETIKNISNQSNSPQLQAKVAEIVADDG